MPKQHENDVTFDERSSSSLLAGLMKQWNALNNQYTHGLTPDIISASKNNLKLASLVNEFQDNNHLIQEIIDKVNTIQRLSQREKIHLSITRLLQDSIEKIEPLIEKHQLLIKTITDRKKQISPSSTDLDELQESNSAALKELKEQLEKFIFQFSLIKFAEKQDSVTQRFREQLILFVHELNRDLKKDELLTNKNQVNFLSKKLLMHLGQKTKLLDLHPITIELDSSFGPLIINTLFSTESIKYEHILKKRIASAYSLSEKINAFPITMIKNYSIIKGQEEEANLLIQQQFEQLSDSLKLLLNKLDKLGLFAPEASVVKQALELKNDLTILQERLNETKNNYNTERTAQSDTIDPLTRLKEITLIQEKTKVILKELAQTLDARTISTEDMLKTLDTEYSKEKNLLAISLEHARTQTELIRLSLTFTEEEKDRVRKGQRQDEIRDNNLLEENKPLPLLAEQVNNQIKNYSEIQQTVKARLHDLLKSRLETIEANLYATEQNYNLELARIVERHHLDQFALSEFNPYKNKLSNNLNETKKAVTAIKSHLEQFNIVRAIELEATRDDIIFSEEIAETLITNLNSILKEALKFEKKYQEEEARRSNTLQYLESVRILHTLEEEYKSIIEQNFFKNQNAQENISELIKIPFILEPNQIISLDKIDSRLSKLASIHIAFNEINAQYLNPKQYDKINDKIYIDQLIGHVNDHLQNDHMEDISNNQSPLIHWLRIYILKPLQRLKNAIYSHNSSYSPTLFASKTETTLINLGKEAVDNLSRREAQLSLNQ